MAEPVQVHIIAASSRSGASLCRSLQGDGIAIVPIVRNATKFPGARIGDLTAPPTLRAALHDATDIVSTAHARFTPAVIDAAPPDARLILLGSTRKFTRWPDEHGNGVIAGEAAFLASSRNAVMLHPTMIYGAQGEDNVQRIAALLHRLPIVPLPGGGRALVQPIHQDDVTRAIRAALDHAWDGPHSLVIAGPDPIAYADFVRAIATAARLRPPRIITLPATPLVALASILRYIPLLPRIRPEEIRRLLEDKAFDIRPMVDTLGFTPMPLAEGLARTFTTRS
jgi:uncharacterized protein YbjT (DUF2867 family)